MLKAFCGRDGNDADLDTARWIDLLNPEADEIDRLQRHFDVAVPTRAQLSEIEASSRLRVVKGALIMSAPLIANRDGGDILSPTGFMLLEQVLVTVRFCESGAFDTVHADIAKADTPPGPREVMVRLLEEVVDRAADRLERVAENVANVSHGIFFEPEGTKHQLSRETRRLRGLMIQIGRDNEQMVKVRHAFLAIGRIASFIGDRCEPKIEPELRDRLLAVRHDIESLDEFENSLSGRIQFLLDAAVGFIGMEQNDVVKILTVVSVAGVPPVLVAGVYGMNFKLMPELDWQLGYPYALVLMVLSTVLPVIWFKWRDWI
ncbi:MAG TPA: magnesium transporter CorA family protein [Sphingomonas sp.]